MRAGQLRHRVELQDFTTTTNEVGEPVQEWYTYATVWGRVSPLRGTERWAAMQAGAQVTHEVEIRHYPGVKAEHRVKFGDRVLNIEAPVTPDERGINLVLPCVEEVE